MPTLEMNTSPAEQESVERPKPAMRFTYPSGSRPLDGYTIKRGVGRGGFGEVYFAVSDAGKEVALKLIRRNLEVELRGVTQCLNLKHENLIDLYDIRTDENDDRWVVMEYVSGASLEDFIERYPDGMPRDMVVQWFRGICSAVAYLHDHGIVHRDLKPANIFIDESRVKIGDYGLSKFISCSRRSGQTESVGTVHYMAPEIANGRYGREIDTYALGIILYEMLTGHVPFEGESVGEVLMKHLTAEPDLSVLGEPFREIVCGAMCKDPDRRIEHCSEMIAMLGDEGASSGEAATIYQPVSRSVPPTDDSNHGGDDFDKRVKEAVYRPSGPAALFVDGPEPVAAFVKDILHAWSEMSGWPRWNPFARFLAILAMIIGGLITWPVWFTLALVYSAYRVFRGTAIHLQHRKQERALNPSHDRRAQVDRPIAAPPNVSPSPATIASPLYGTKTQPVTNPVSTPKSPERIRRPWRRRERHKTWRQAVNAHLTMIPFRDRASELFGSLLVAALVSTVASFLICLFTWTPFQAELFLWLSVVATLSCWSIMVPAKIAEGRVEDQAPLRFSMLILGALVGAVAWGLSEVMFLGVPLGHDFAPSYYDSLFQEFFDNNSVTYLDDNHAVKMPLAMFSAYFAFLFVVLRWWKLAECSRPTRVAFWATIKCAVVAWLTTLLWWFPQPIGMLLAASIAFTVQLSSPWMSTGRRQELVEELRQRQYA